MPSPRLLRIGFTLAALVVAAAIVTHIVVNWPMLLVLAGLLISTGAVDHRKGIGHDHPACFARLCGKPLTNA